MTRMNFVFTTLLFRALLEYGYITQISPLFDYAGFNIDIDNYQYYTGWIICITGSLIIPYKLLNASSFFVMLTWLLLGIPMLMLYSLDASRSFLPVLLFLTSIAIIYISTSISLIRIRSFRPILGGTNILTILSIIMVSMLVVWFAISGASFNLSLASVYDFRSSNAELTDSGLFAYTNNWTIKIMSLFLFAIALKKKQYFGLLVLAIIQIYFYGITNHKSVLFTPFLIFGCWFIFQKRNSFTAIPLACSAVIFLSLLASEVFEFTMLTSLFIRRVFLVPADLVFTYVEFFSNNDLVFWSNSIFSSFNTYPYSESIARTIGDFTGTGANANAGFIATGYAHLGFAGVIIYSLIISIILKFINFSSKGIEPWIMTALLILPFRTLIVASDLLTTLLTHGLLLTCLLLYLYSKNSAKLIEHKI